MRLFKSKLRKRIEDKITEYSKAVANLKHKVESRKIKQTLNPAEYSHYSVSISDLNSDIELLQEILK